MDGLRYGSSPPRQIRANAFFFKPEPEPEPEPEGRAAVEPRRQLALSGYAEPLARQHRFAEAIRGHSTSPEGWFPPCPVCPTLPR